MGALRIEIVRGDITNQTVDAVVTGVVDATRPGDHVTERRAARTHDAAAAMMASLRRQDAQRSERELLARRDLAHGVEPAPQQQPASAARDDERHVPPDAPQGRQIEVVAVEMRQEHGVEPAEQLRRRQRCVPPQVHHAVAQQRVGEHSHAVEVDQHGAMADPGDFRHPRKGMLFPRAAARIRRRRRARDRRGSG